MKFIHVMLALVFLCAGLPVVAEAGCLHAVQAQALIKAKYPEAEVILLTEARAADFVTAFNDEPPRSNLIANQVLIAWPPARNMAVRLDFYIDGCSVARAHKHPRDVRRWLKFRDKQGRQA